MQIVSARFLLNGLFVAIFILPGWLSAQGGTLVSDKLFCIWNQASLRSGPGQDFGHVTGVFFGEMLQKTGQEAYAAGEKRTYIQVKNSEGVVGWVQEFLFVEGQAMAVVTQPGRIYKRPRTVSTLTDQAFLPGEMVVLIGESEGWVQLIGREKKQVGWIEGSFKITTSMQELELASLLHDANRKPNAAQRNQALTQLRAEAQRLGSPLAQAIDMTISGQAYQPDLVSGGPVTPSSPQGRISSGEPVGSIDYYAAQPARRTTAPTDSWNASAGATRTNAASWNASQPAASGSWAEPAPASSGQVRSESGRATIISNLAYEPDIYYAYHRELAPGTKIYVDIPGNAGFIELRVVGRLPAGSPYLLGLPAACYEALVGNSPNPVLSLSYEP